MKRDIRFYIFRHGETNWNVEKRLQGHTNTKLNKKGQQQSILLKKKISQLNLDIIYSSDLDRAFETASLASIGLNIEIKKDSRLREARFGDAEGMTISDIQEKFGLELWDAFKMGSPEAQKKCFPNGESRADSIVRMRSVLEEIDDSTEYNKVGISTHGGVVRNLLHSYLPEDADMIDIPNCVLYELKFENNEIFIEGPLS